MMVLVPVGLAELGARQFGLVSRRQALERRMTSGQPLGRYRRDVMLELIEARRGDKGRGVSAGEDWIWDTIAAAGIPLPVRHHPVWVGGRWCELDFAYQGERCYFDCPSSKSAGQCRQPGMNLSK